MCALPTLSGNPVPSIPSPSVIPSPARVERVQNGKRSPEIWRYTTLVTLTQNATKRQFAIVGAAHTISIYPTLVPLLPHNRAVPDTTGNIFGKNSGKKIGKKIGKAGKAARLLTLAFPETTTTRTPERINIHASHTTPAIPPATLPAKNRQHFRQHLRQKWQSRTASRASSAVAIPATAASPPKIETAAKTATSIPATLRPLSGHSPATLRPQRSPHDPSPAHGEGWPQAGMEASTTGHSTGNTCGQIRHARQHLPPRLISPKVALQTYPTYPAYPTHPPRHPTRIAGKNGKKIGNTSSSAIS